MQGLTRCVGLFFYTCEYVSATTSCNSNSLPFCNRVMISRYGAVELWRHYRPDHRRWGSAGMQAEPRRFVGHPGASGAGGPAPPASVTPPYVGGNKRRLTWLVTDPQYLPAEHACAEPGTVALAVTAASPAAAASALTSPIKLNSTMVLAYGALARSQHSLAAAAAFLKAPILTAPIAAFAPPIACAVAPACAMRPPLTYFVPPRARNLAPYKRPAQPTRKPAGSAKQAYSNPYTRFCQEQRPLLPKTLCNTEREKVLGRMWKTHRLGFLEAEKSKREETDTAVVDSLPPGAPSMEDRLLQEQLARLRGSWSRESHATNDV